MSLNETEAGNEERVDDILGNIRDEGDPTDPARGSLHGVGRQERSSRRLAVTDRRGNRREERRRHELHCGDDPGLRGATLPVGEDDHRDPRGPLRAVEHRERRLDTTELSVPGNHSQHVEHCGRIRPYATYDRERPSRR